MHRFTIVNVLAYSEDGKSAVEKFIRDKKLDGKIQLTDENTFVMDNEVRACFVNSCFAFGRVTIHSKTQSIVLGVHVFDNIEGWF